MIPPLSLEQAEVFRMLEGSRDHFFVTGRAGTGKSTLLEHLNHHTAKSIAICAPTGVAALGVGGQTIHSLFRFAPGLVAAHEFDFGDYTEKLLNAIDTLVVDEISMVNADLMDGIDRALREVRARPAEPFGGVQMILFGDPYQLPPVEPRDPHERAYLEEHYRSLWFFDARVWRETQLRIVELIDVHRQDDREFKRLLNAVRHGEVTLEDAAALNAAGARRPLPEREVITLATRNDQVNRTNERQLAALAGTSKTLTAELNGEWGSSPLPAERELVIKPGAQVMFLRNDTMGGQAGPRWVNGSIGEVVTVGKQVIVELAGEHYEVGPEVWSKYRYAYDPVSKVVEREIVAEFIQYPLRLAWAVTIHKSQGATFERAIIDLGAGAFANGQTYVALSRLTALEGLYLTRPLEPRDVRVDSRVREFMAPHLSAR